MTIAELLANEPMRQREFPVVRERVFLGHAGVCPLPRRVSEAISKYAQQCATGDQEEFVYPMILSQGRKLAAQLLYFEADEVAFVGLTSLGLRLFAGGLSFRKGAKVLLHFDGYSAYLS